eukprot:TRINITY_DN9877_c0_g1_i1.p1 TRINITY_DN9877_c0_g1~~TRINITY_DN9877_c0_g1_i1.p1  ORF type:complete len:728 (-),score=114.20 TRINITY_DN9877_c0_g1_i1:372-2483(-)
MAERRALELLTHQVGKATRVAQRSIEKFCGKGAHRAIFSACDALIVQIAQLPSGCSSEPECTLSVDGCSSENSEQDSLLPDPATQTFTEEDIDALVQDRLQCIEPVLRSEIILSLKQLQYDVPDAPSPSPMQRLRRNVGAHPRGDTAAIKISSLSMVGLRRAQKAAKGNYEHRIALLESMLDGPSTGQRQAATYNERFQSARHAQLGTHTGLLSDDGLNSCLEEVLKQEVHSFSNVFSTGACSFVSRLPTFTTLSSSHEVDEPQANVFSASQQAQAASALHMCDGIGTPRVGEKILAILERLELKSTADGCSAGNGESVVHDSLVDQGNFTQTLPAEEHHFYGSADAFTQTMSLDPAPKDVASDYVVLCAEVQRISQFLHACAFFPMPMTTDASVSHAGLQLCEDGACSSHLSADDHCTASDRSTASAHDSPSGSCTVVHSCEKGADDGFDAVGEGSQHCGTAAINEDNFDLQFTSSCLGDQRALGCSAEVSQHAVTTADHFVHSPGECINNHVDIRAGNQLEQQLDRNWLKSADTATDSSVPSSNIGCTLAELVQRVKAIQRSSRKSAASWRQFCDTHASHTYDPSKLKPCFLSSWIASEGAVDDAPPKPVGNAGIARMLRRNGKGRCREIDIHSISSFQDLDKLLDHLLQRITVVMRAGAPRAHHDYESLRFILQELIAVAPFESDTHTITSAMLDKLDSA